MKIELAKHPGFCSGVRKAIFKIADEISECDEDILIYGPLIHNPQTVSILESRGLKTIKNLDSADDSVIAIRTHGIPQNDYKKIKQKSKRIINLTCPKVAKIHAIVKKHSKQGYFTIIFGDKNHAEVDGILSYAESGYYIISDKKDMQEIPEAEKYLVIAQTTIDRNFFHKSIKILEKKLKNSIIINTICDSTHNRQKGLVDLINKGIDTLIVVGGKHSGNTKRLADIGRENNLKTYHIETEKELNEPDFKNAEYVAVTAGASTPSWIINNVLEKLYTIKFNKKTKLINLFKNFIEFILRTNVFSSFMAFFITLLIQNAGSLKDNFVLPMISFFYLFSMSSINNYFKIDALKTSDPFKYNLHKKFSKFLLIMSLIFLTLSVYLFINFDTHIFIFYLCLIFFGSIYSTPITKKIIKSFKISIIEKLYFSRSLISSAGFVVIAITLPYLVSPYDIYKYLILAIPIGSIFFIRNILIDLIAYQSDLIMGNYTVHTILGTRKTSIFSLLISGISIISIIYFAFNSANYYWLVSIAAIIYYCLLFYHFTKLQYFYNLKYEILVDLNLLIFPLLYFNSIKLNIFVFLKGFLI